MDKEFANRMLDFIRYDIAFDAKDLEEHYRLLGVYLGINAAQPLRAVDGGDAGDFESDGE